MSEDFTPTNIIRHPIDGKELQKRSFIFIGIFFAINFLLISFYILKIFQAKKQRELNDHFMSKGEMDSIAINSVSSYEAIY